MDAHIPVWDLAGLYPSLDHPSLSAALDQAEAAFTALEDQAGQPEASQGSHVADLLAAFDQAALAFSDSAAYVSLKAMVEPPSAALSRQSVRVSAIKLRQDQLWTRLLELLKAVPDPEALFAARPDLAPYRYPVEEFSRLSAHRPPAPVREAITAMQQTGGQGWLRLRNQLDGAAAAPLRPGETPLPLAQLRGLAASPQRETRRLAYEAEQRLYPTYAVPMAACFNGIKGEALTELSWKAYSSVEAEMLDINKISAQTLQSMFAAIEGHLPHFRRYLRQKAAALGCPNGLPWYDLLAPMEGIPAGFSFAQASEMLVGALDSFSPEIGALARRALDNGWIDALPAAGKQGGAICVDLPARRENRVLLSYSGTFRCIRTMAHELGHAYHARCLDAIPLLLRDAPTPICETASLMNEVVFQSKTLEQLPAQQRFPLLECDLQECTQTVLDIYSRYLFEREVFALRAQRELLPEDFCRLMTDAQKAVFGDALDPQALHPYMWMCKVHYYIPEYHYYNYPYIFGLLLAKGLYARYLAQPGGFPQAYRQLLAATCSGSMEDIAAKAGVDIRSQAFWDSALDLIVKDIDAWISWSREGGGSFS